MIKALTVCQPYASMIARGEKCIENRTWHTSYRGYLAIHAGKSLSYYPRGEKPSPDTPFGAIVAVVYLERVFRINEENLNWCKRQGPAWYDHAEGPICWVLSEVHALDTPIPRRGERGLYDLTGEDLASIRRRVTL